MKHSHTLRSVKSKYRGSLTNCFRSCFVSLLVHVWIKASASVSDSEGEDWRHLCCRLTRRLWSSCSDSVIFHSPASKRDINEKRKVNKSNNAFADDQVVWAKCLELWLDVAGWIRLWLAVTHMDAMEVDAPVGSGAGRDEPVSVFTGRGQRRVSGRQGSHHLRHFLQKTHE